MADTTAARALRELIASYNELNGATIDELYHEPSPLEFMRYVSRNTPFVIRGGAQWRAHQLWSPGIPQARVERPNGQCCCDSSRKC